VLTARGQHKGGNFDAARTLLESVNLEVKDGQSPRCFMPYHAVGCEMSP
jgi:hypothetical protein